MIFLPPLFTKVDQIIDNLATHNEVICSKVEKVDGDLATHNEIVCSKLENVTSLVENVDDSVTVLCSKLEKVDDDLISICSKIEKVDDDLVTHNDIVCSKLENISSKLDELEFAGPCEILIFQSDIPFTADRPGVYCLAESVSFAIGTAITIAADNVLLDLNEKKIDGSAGGDVGIAINSGLSNITVQNGVLCNMNNKGIDVDATNNIAFISMSALDSLVDMPARVAPITCLQIKDVKVIDVGIFKEFPIVLVVDSIIDSLIDTPDCVLSPITGININCVVELILDNCHVFSCLGDGFALQMTEHSLIKSCNALRNGSNGFVLGNADTTRLKWCEATMNCFHGFCDSACNADNLYNGCVAKQNGINGFNIAGGGKALQECVASQNNQNGFNLTSSLIADASLDTTFGTGGIVITPDTTTIVAIAIQKDGKIIAIGSVSGDFIIARYNTDGSLDTMFGVGGLVITDFGPGDSARDVAIQKDGKIVVAGLSSALVLVARYTVNGDLDLTFGSGGSVIADLGAGSVIQSIALQKDGKIVVAGSVAPGADTDFATARFNTDGSLDLSFGIGGVVITDLGGDTNQGNAVAIQKDGKIVVAGFSDAGGLSFDFAVARYNTDGSLDATFNPIGIVPGTVITNFGGITSTDDRGRAVAIQKDGKIVVAGESDAGGGFSNFAVARYNTDGSLDATFNPAGSLPGTVTTDFAGLLDIGFSVAIQKDGKIVVAGESFVSGSPEFAVARYKVNGVLDASFNPTGPLPGTVITDIGPIDSGRAVAIQKDGKIVVGGGSDNDFALVRYNVFKQGVVIRDCIAEENGIDGFRLCGTTFMIKNSSAINNVEDGFFLKSVTDGCQLLSNEALKNNNIGIENLGTDNQILNNRSHSNTTSNYAGVALVATPTSTTGFWENVEA